MWHLSIDIETTGKAPSGAIIAIGARLFNKDELGRGFEIYIDQNSATQFGTVDDSTMQWWSKQNHEVYQQAFSGKILAPDAAVRFLKFVEDTKPEQVWAYPPQFDIVIMQHWFEQIGLKWPFHYRAERCARTLRAWGESYGLSFDDCFDGITKHLPLDDATAQAKVIQRVMNLKVTKPKKAV